MNVISLGAGVQSSAMALMAAHREITPMPDYAIFADTQAEPQSVYDWLDWLEDELPFPVLRVSRGNLLEAVLSGGGGDRLAPPPFYTSSNGKREGLLRRQCTREYKVEPIEKELRRLLGYKPRQRIPRASVSQWLGISWDEMQRMKEARSSWVLNRWPLIEKQLTRLHCLEWMERRNFPLPSKSACTFCPYHDNATWRRMKRDDIASWDQAIEVDEAIRSGFDKTNQQLFVHRSLEPLAIADLSDPAENQGAFSFMDECDGMCGV